MRSTLLRVVAALAVTLSAPFAWGQVADPNTSTANSAGGHVFSCPLGDGGTLAAAGATVNVNIRDIFNVPIGGYPTNLVWLSDVGGMLQRCTNGSNPALPTDPLGNTMIAGALSIGGWADSTNPLQIFIGPGGTPLTGPALSITTNNPDMVADLVVNLCDINQLAWDFGGAYRFRSDLVMDGVLDLADIARFAGHVCHTCGGNIIGTTLPSAGGRVGIFFDPAGPPYVQDTLAIPMFVPFNFYVVVDTVPAIGAIDIPLRMDPGITIISSTTAPPSITSPLGGGTVLFGNNCFNAPTQTQLIQVTAFLTAPGPQRIGFGTPGVSCSGIPGPIYKTCTPTTCDLTKFQLETRATLNGVNNVADPFVSVANTAGACILACPAGDGDRLDAVGATIVATLFDVAGNLVTVLNESDFELDGAPPNTLNISDCQFHVPEFVETTPGAYTFGGRLSAGGQTQAGLQLKVQGSFLAGASLPIDVVSPDINGDGVVNLVDIGTFSMDLNAGYAFRSDFNCDGVLNLSDVGDIAMHNGHGFGCVVDPVD